MLSRVIEEHGIATTTIVMVREHAERVKPPRALFVPFFFGFALGKPNDAGLPAWGLEGGAGPAGGGGGSGAGGFPRRFGDPTLMPQASQVTASPEQAARSAADEITALRAFYERWVDNNSGRTAVGLCGVPQRRFRGVIRFLEACAQGDEEADLAERPDGVSKPQFIRYCVDDLKAFYYEARMEQNREADEDSLHRWFWGETATGKLVPTWRRY